MHSGGAGKCPEPVKAWRVCLGGGVPEPRALCQLCRVILETGRGRRVGSCPFNTRGVSPGSQVAARDGLPAPGGQAGHLTDPSSGALIRHLGGWTQLTAHLWPPVGATLEGSPFVLSVGRDGWLSWAGNVLQISTDSHYDLSRKLRTEVRERWRDFAEITPLYLFKVFVYFFGHTRS